jgi:hypothetical protein
VRFLKFAAKLTCAILDLEKIRDRRNFKVEYLEFYMTKISEIKIQFMTNIKVNQNIN